MNAIEKIVKLKKVMLFLLLATLLVNSQVSSAVTYTEVFFAETTRTWDDYSYNTGFLGSKTHTGDFTLSVSMRLGYAYKLGTLKYQLKSTRTQTNLDVAMFGGVDDVSKGNPHFGDMTIGVFLYKNNHGSMDVASNWYTDSQVERHKTASNSDLLDGAMEKACSEIVNRINPILGCEPFFDSGVYHSQSSTGVYYSFFTGYKSNNDYGPDRGLDAGLDIKTDDLDHQYEYRLYVYQYAYVAGPNSDPDGQQIFSRLSIIKLRFPEFDPDTLVAPGGGGNLPR